MAIDPSLYADVKKDLLELIRTKRCNPLMIRLAWHDSGTFDKVCSGFAAVIPRRGPQRFGSSSMHVPVGSQNISSFPERGGANGSVRFKPECDHAANAGTVGAKVIPTVCGLYDFSNLVWLQQESST